MKKNKPVKYRNGQIMALIIAPNIPYSKKLGTWSKSLNVISTWFSVFNVEVRKPSDWKKIKIITGVANIIKFLLLTNEIR